MHIQLQAAVLLKHGPSSTKLNNIITMLEVRDYYVVQENR